jgi:hypothetical protein
MLIALSAVAGAFPCMERGRCLTRLHTEELIWLEKRETKVSRRSFGSRNATKGTTNKICVNFNIDVSHSLKSFPFRNDINCLCDEIPWNKHESRNVPASWPLAWCVANGEDESSQSSLYSLSSLEGAVPPMIRELVTRRREP